MGRTTMTTMALAAGMGFAGCGRPSPMQMCVVGESAACRRVQDALEVSFRGTGSADGERVRLLAERAVETLRAGAPELAPAVAECRRGAPAACDRLAWAAAGLMMGADASLQGHLGRAMTHAMSGGVKIAEF